MKHKKIKYVKTVLLICVSTKFVFSLMFYLIHHTVTTTIGSTLTPPNVLGPRIASARNTDFVACVIDTSKMSSTARMQIFVHS